MFTEQYRLVAGLVDVFNDLFYDNQVTNADCTRLQNRPEARAAIHFI